MFREADWLMDTFRTPRNAGPDATAMTGSSPPTAADPATLLDRHARRRSDGIPTVTVLVGPAGAGGAAWRRWAAGAGLPVVVADANAFPTAEWVDAVAARTPLPAATICRLAERAGRSPGDLLGEWPTKTPADRERFWDALPPAADDDILREIAAGPAKWAAFGERIVSAVAGLVPAAATPGVLFRPQTAAAVAAVGRAAAEWAVRVPAVPLAVAVTGGVWLDFVAAEPESRAKALLTGGEIVIPAVPAAAVERALAAAGVAAGAAAAVVAAGATAELVAGAVSAAEATAAPPASAAEDDHARSAAERFLFDFLEMLPATAGRFALNAKLDFRFGPRPAEVDFLCAAARLVVEVDGYYHFQNADAYRRDRAKDWELQRRGYRVLRFLAEDVTRRLEDVRDRILDALSGDAP